MIGSGPNGLAGAITLARAGFDVEVLERADTIGGGARTAELTLPGFRHDTCSAIHPLAAASPFFRALDLELDWVEPPAAVAHPFDDGTAVAVERSVEATAAQLGSDAAAYWKLLAPLVAAWEPIAPLVLGPHPPPVGAVGALAARLGVVPAVRSAAEALSDARSFAERRFAGDRGRALFAGHSAHAQLPLERRPSAGFGLSLAVLAHVAGWGFPRGGSQVIADALVAELARLGGRVRTGVPVDALPAADVVLADVMPRALAALAGGRLPARYAGALRRYRHGPGAFKLDWALAGPIPWRADECRRAATVHLGGTLDEIAESERAAWTTSPATRPFVILAQHTLFDESRAPAGRHTAWAYCHVPNGSATDMTAAIEAQIERFAPGFRELVLARRATSPAALEAENPNYVGGDIGGGATGLDQLFFRPVRRLVPYRTPLRGVYLCSSATPPGVGVHGMCGLSAAQAALRDVGAAL